MEQEPISLCIDRLEDGLAVCESADGRMYTFSPGQLPEGSREGDWLLLTPLGVLLPDPKETERRRKRVLELQARLLNRGKTPE